LYVPICTFRDTTNLTHCSLQIVFNPSTYPNFLRFLALYPNLEAAVLPTEMTFSVSREQGLFEWAGNANGLRAVFTHLRSVFEGKMWRLLYDVLRFNACARRLVMANDQKPDKSGDVAEDEDEKLSIGEYLAQEGYSHTFRDDYLIVSGLAVPHILG
jgi:predicted NAD/FAD-binding protein